MKSKQYSNKNKCTSFIVCLSLTGYIFITCNQNLEHIKVNLFWLFRNDLSCSVYYSSLFSKCITWYFFPKWKNWFWSAWNESSVIPVSFPAQAYVSLLQICIMIILPCLEDTIFCIAKVKPLYMYSQKMRMLRSQNVLYSDTAV